MEGTWVVRTKREIDPQVTYSGCRSLVIPLKKNSKDLLEFGNKMSFPYNHPSPWLGRPAPGHVLAEGNKPHDVDGEFQVGDALHGADDTRGPAHIRFHVWHSRRRFETDAA